MSISTPGLYRAPEKKQTIEDIAKSIISITGDDEHLTKISIKALEEIYASLSGRPIEKPPPTEDETAKMFHNFMKNTPLYESLVSNFIPKKETPKNDANKLTDEELDILRKIQQKSECKVSKPELVNIGINLSKKSGVDIKKRCKRSKKNLLEWIHQNWETFEPILPEAIDNVFKK